MIGIRFYCSEMYCCHTKKQDKKNKKRNGFCVLTFTFLQDLHFLHAAPIFVKVL